MTISFARHQFPPAIIRHAVWLYVRFTLSYRAGGAKPLHIVGYSNGGTLRNAPQ
jgi:hypothetical protein